MATLEDKILQHHGGVAKNDLNLILQKYSDDDDNINMTSHSSSYQSLDGLVDKFSNLSDYFLAMSLNCQSLSAKYDQLLILVNHLLQKNIKVGALCLQETWLREESDMSLFHIPNYNYIAQGKYSSEHGGLLVYLHNTLSYQKYKLPIKPSIWECMIIKIFSDNNEKDIYLVNIYRPPKANYSSETIHDFIAELSRIMYDICNSNSIIIMLGDFNIDLLKMHERIHFKDYFLAMIGLGLLPHITLPTRLTETSSTLIDNIYSNIPHNNHLRCTSGILVSDISDHFLCYNSVSFKWEKTEVSKYIYHRKCDNNSINNLIRDFEGANISNRLDKKLDADPNENYHILENALSNLIKKHMPMCRSKFNKYKHKKSSWISFGILKSLQYRDKLYQSLKRLPPNSIEYFNCKQNLSTFNRILKRSIRDAKRIHFHRKFEDCKNDTKKTWTTINEVINRSESKGIPEYIKINNNKVSNCQDIAEHFNTYFSNIGVEMDSNIKIDNNITFKDYFTEHVTSTFNLSMVDEEKVQSCISNLKSKTSSGHDGISTYLLKHLNTVIAAPLAIIINQSIRSGIVPNSLKIAKITPVHKKDDAHLVTNYRPISLLPALSKVFEKVVYDQLFDYLKTNNLFDNGQYGFRNGHSTEHAVLEVVDRVTFGLDQGRMPLAIYLDLSKAFDTLNFEIVLKKLEHYGIQPTSLAWFESYLENRKQYVEINNVKSKITSVSLGVPQGSILGPLLFTIYVNDIQNSSDFFQFIKYADDTTLLNIISVDNVVDITETINKELIKVHKWLCANKLSLNLKKTKFMVFYNQGKKLHNIPTIKLDDTPIERVETFNFLGIHINEKLNHNCHKDQINMKLLRCIGILYKLKHILPTCTLKIIYNSLFMSHITYGILIWGHNTTGIYQIQKKAVRIITNSAYNAHTTPLFKLLNCLKVDDLYTLNVLKFYFKYCNEQLPNYFLQFKFSSRSTMHTYDIRSKELLHIPKTRTKMAERSIRIATPRIVNKIEPNILTKIHSHSLSGFILYIKRYFIENYSVECHIHNCYVCTN
jgi:hypothetical protein